MSFSPNFSVNINGQCNALIIEDTTGVYDSISNPTGWDDNSTLYKTSSPGWNYVTSSYIKIKRNGVYVIFGSSGVDVLNVIQQSGNSSVYTLLNFSFTDSFGNPILWNGTYDIEWVITNQSPGYNTTYTYTSQIVVSCYKDPANNLNPQLLVTADGCKGLIIKDNTGLFNNPYNFNGWGDSTTSYKSTPPIVSAELVIKKNGIPLGAPYDVLNQIITSPLNVGTYTLLNYYPTSLDDGTYEVEWTLVTYNNVPGQNWLMTYQTTSSPVVINCKNDFIPKIKAVISNCESLVIKDVTGTYNVTTNPTGWNDSNTLYKKNTLGTPYVTSAILSIQKQGSEILGNTIDVTQVVNNSIKEEYELFSSIDFNYNFQDGIYKIKLTITDDNSVTYVVETTKVVYCKAQNCVTALASKLAYELCEDCNTEDFETFNVASTFLNSLDKLALCNETEFYKMLTKINKFCNLSSVGGCDCDCTYEINTTTS